MFIDILNHPDIDKFDLTSLYTGVMAGSPCPIETMRQVIQKMNMSEVTVSHSSFFYCIYCTNHQCFRCTSLYGVPTMFIDMLNHPDVDKFDITSLYTGIMGGSPCPTETMKQVTQKMHMSQVTVSG